MRRRRRALAAAAPEAGAEAARRLPDDALPPIRVFAAYLPAGGEMDPSPLARRLLALGAAQVLPRVTEDGQMRFLEAPPGCALEPDAAGQP
ncbi:hypothetical protein, partial [Phenylobacterium sp.]|uniref:hypothetical protein n=1 Tax=Phenylobacterium sp. TaxID=1871053 RepID=UPI0025D96937